MRDAEVGDDAEPEQPPEGENVEDQSNAQKGNCSTNDRDEREIVQDQVISFYCLSFNRRGERSSQ